MTLTHILIFTIGALVARLVPTTPRRWLIFAFSVLALYWLQPFTPLPVYYFFPMATLGLGIAGWLLTRPADSGLFAGENRFSWALMALLVLAANFLGEPLALIRLAPPLETLFLPAAALIIGFVVVMALLTRALKNQNTRLIWWAIAALIGLFVLLKTETLTVGLAAALRAAAGRDTSLASPLDLGWLGFSYVAFRLIHTLRDKQMGRLPALTLREYLTYLIFFPAVVAGPIDRAERFGKDLAALPALDANRLLTASLRIALGLGKKFILAIFALNATLAGQASRPGDFWLLLYAFALRLYFDFSGYSDIAIGIGKLYGIDLPENFSAPYLKSNITAFWQSWHATLSNWARLYIFTPFTRVLMLRLPSLPNYGKIFLAHLLTMLIIGLWHGVSVNFAVWGLWQAIGLFGHKYYSDRTREFYRGLKQKPNLARAVYVAGVVVTFNFVALGWVWFALPTPELSLRVLRGLFGLPL
jgi:alginate O-acetyltransferase complex protein AlgI